MPKESLSIMTVKTLLAVLIFTGVGTIIIGGGLLIGRQEKISKPVKLSQEQPAKIIEEEIKDETADWQTYRNEEYGFEMKYPEDFFTEQVLQPKTKIIQCDYAIFFNNCPGEIKNVNNTPFCLQKTDEGAAGITYTTYNYTTVRDKECFVVFFTVPYPNCSNFLPISSHGIQKAYGQCKENEITKPKIINQIISTFKFTEK